MPRSQVVEDFLPRKFLSRRGAHVRKRRIPSPKRNPCIYCRSFFSNAIVFITTRLRVSSQISLLSSRLPSSPLWGATSRSKALNSLRFRKPGIKTKLQKNVLDDNGPHKFEILGPCSTKNFYLSVFISCIPQPLNTSRFIPPSWWRCVKPFEYLNMYWIPQFDSSWRIFLVRQLGTRTKDGCTVLSRNRICSFSVCLIYCNLPGLNYCLFFLFLISSKTNRSNASIVPNRSVRVLCQSSIGIWTTMS